MLSDKSSDTIFRDPNRFSFSDDHCVEVLRDDFGTITMAVPENSSHRVYNLTADAIGMYLEPIKSIIYEKFAPLSPQAQGAVLDQADFYTFHRQFFLDWMANRVPSNEDSVLFFAAEYSFETTRWFRSLAQLFHLLFSRDQVFLILGNFQYTSQGTLSFLRQLMSLDQKGRYKIICFIQGNRNWTGPTFLDQWNEFLDVHEKENSLYRATYIPDVGTPNNPSPSPEYVHAKTTSAKDKDYEREIFLRIQLKSYADALVILRQWKPRTPTLQGLSHYFAGLIAYLMHDADGALLELHTALDLLKSRNRRDIKFNCYLLLTRIFANKKVSVDAYASLSRAYSIQKRTNSLSDLIECQLHEVFLIDILGGSPDTLDFFNDLTSNLKQQGFYNKLSYLRSLMPLYTSYIATYGWEQSEQLARSALAQVQQEGNTYRESVMFHVLGYLYEQKEDIPQALHYLLRSIELRQELKDPVELIKIYNGTGYFCFVVGRFSQALDFFSKALSLLQDQKDYTEICLTQMNLAMVYFFSGNYLESLKYLETVLEVMDNLGFEFLPWHQPAKIYSLAGCAAWHSGAHSKALDYLNLLHGQAIEGESVPYAYFFEGLTAYYSQAYQRAAEYFQKAIDASNGTSQKYLIIHSWVEKAIALKKLGQDSESEQAFDAAMTITGNFDQPWPSQWVAQRKDKPGQVHGVEWKVDISELSFLTQILRNNSVQEATNTRLIDKLQEIQFLRRFQTEIHSGLSRSDILKTSLKLINEQFIPKRVAVYETGKSRPRVLGKYGIIPRGHHLPPVRFPLSSHEGELWMEFYTRHSKYSLYEEEQRILGLIVSHLNIILDLIQTKNNLQVAASFDSLTGLLNRRELLHRIHEEEQRCKRLNKAESSFFSLLFIDLDNFKVYNDRLGHKAGDWILKKFADVLLTITRSSDVCGRYGGDEFLVLLPGTPLSGAQLVAQKILDQITSSRGFIDQLKEEGFNEAVPEDVYLSCSIGIKLFDIREAMSVDRLIQEADNNLYKAKNAGKGAIISA